MVMGLIDRSIPFSEVYLGVIVFLFIGFIGSRVFLILLAKSKLGKPTETAKSIKEAFIVWST